MGYRTGVEVTCLLRKAQDYMNNYNQRGFSTNLPELQVFCLPTAMRKNMSVQWGSLWREGNLKMEDHLYMIIYCKLIIQAILNKNIEFMQTFLHPQECRAGRELWITVLLPVTLGTILQDIFHKLEEDPKILYAGGYCHSLHFTDGETWYLEGWNDEAMAIQ